MRQADVFGRKLVGKSSKHVASVLEREFVQYQFDWSATYRENVGIERYRIGPLVYILLYYEDIQDVHGNIAESDRVTRYEIASLADLTSRVSNIRADILELIHQSPSPASAGFDPFALIAAVNGLHSLGKTEALRVLKAYCDLATAGDQDMRFKYDLDEQRIFLILRLLFVPKDGTSEMPPLNIGGRVPPLRVGANAWPLFPLAVQGNIPFFMIDGHILAGVPESPLVHLEYCKNKCILRPDLLMPISSADEAVRQMVESERWKNLFAWQPSLEARCKQLLQEQALRVQEFHGPIPNNSETTDQR